MTLKERIQSKSTPLGRFCKTWLAGVLTLIALIGGLGEYFSLMPQVIADTIPLWVKHAVFYAGVISWGYGHWTVFKSKTDEQV